MMIRDRWKYAENGPPNDDPKVKRAYKSSYTDELLRLAVEEIRTGVKSLNDCHKVTFIMNFFIVVYNVNHF